MDPKLISHLEKLPLFKGAPAAILAKIADKVKILHLSRGDFLARQGDDSDSLFVIRTGWIKIVAEGPQGE